MEAFDLITKIGGGISGVVTVIMLILAYRSGLLSFLMGKGGGAAEVERVSTEPAIVRFDSIDAKLALLEGNHLAHVQADLAMLKDQQGKMLDLQRDTVQVLREIQKYGVRCSSDDKIS